MRKGLLIAVMLIVFGVSAWAQESKHEITVQGSGFLTNETTKGGLTNSPTYSGGVMAGYRFHVNKWLGVEGDYDYFRNDQKYFALAGSTRIPMNVHGVTGLGVIKLPSVRNITPFVLAGGGMMVFDSRTAAGNGSQNRGSFVYGGGADMHLLRHVALRAQYRGFVYKVPDFETRELRMDKFTHSAVPSAGFVFDF